jgi:hypothetical protein
VDAGCCGQSVTIRHFCAVKELLPAKSGTIPGVFSLAPP